MLSIDAVGAYDHVSRQAMLEGLRSRPALVPLLPFARQFYAAPAFTPGSTTTATNMMWCKAKEENRAIRLCRRSAALSEAAAGLREGEAIFAFWTTRTSCRHRNAPGNCTGPWKTRCGAMRASACTKARPAYGMRQVRNPATLPASSRFVLFCASPRANYLLRMLPPGATQAFAREHDNAVRACLAALLFQSTQHPLPEPSQRLAHLPLRFGGLGLRSAVDAAPTAYCGIVGRLLADHSGTGAADRLVQALQSATETAAPLAAARHVAACLREQGYTSPPMGFAAAGAAATRTSRPRIRRLSAGLAASAYPCQ